MDNQRCYHNYSAYRLGIQTCFRQFATGKDVKIVLPARGIARKEFARGYKDAKKKLKKMKINPNKNYTPKEAAELVMTANTKNTRQQMMWRKIRNGEIEAIDIEDGDRSRYIIKGHELVRYKNS